MARMTPKPWRTPETWPLKTDGSTQEDKPLPAPGAARWIALAGLWLVYAAFGAMTAGLAPLLPEIRADFGAGNTMMGAILGAWPLTYIVAAIPCGLLLDRLGVRSGIFIATLIIALSGILRALAGSPAELLVAVAVFGFGGPLISVGAPKMIASLFEGPSRGMAMGIYITGPSVGAIAVLSATHDWLLPLVGDWRGAMLFHAGTALACGLVWLAAAAFATSPGVKADGVSFDGRALLAMLRQREVLLVLAMAVGIFYINHALNNWLPAILRFEGVGASTAGFWASVPTLVGLAAAVSIPRLATPARRLPMLGALYAVAFVASLLLTTQPGPGLAAGLILQGIARGTMNTIAILVLVELPSIPRDRIGMAGGIFFSAAEIGGVLGPLMFGTLRDATGGFLVPLLSLAAVSTVLMALTAALRRAGRYPA